jgi:hypothetical protein
MNSEYKRHAYARTILADLRRYLVERYTPATGSIKATLTCEEVFYADRFVPQEALQEMVQRLKRMEDQEQATMSEFTTSRSKQQSEEPTGKETSNEQKGSERRKRKAQGE